MSFVIRPSIGLSVLGLALAFAAAPMTEAGAQIPVAQLPVQTFEEQVVTPTAVPGVLPEGIEWNRPMKAGDMVLPRKIAPKEKTAPKQTAPLTRPSLGIKAPQLGAASAPSVADTKTDSPASMMLMQGMKSALQKSGQSVEPTKAEAPKTLDAQLAPPLPITARTTTEEGEAFVAGQEPKTLGALEKSGAELKAAPDGMMEITFPPEMAKSASATASAPASDVSEKATELTQAPRSLEDAPAPLAAPQTEVTESANTTAKSESFFDRVAEPFTSIFGKPVDEKAEKTAPAATTATAQSEQTLTLPKSAASSSPAAKACDPTVTKWTRDCADGGYPAHFVGQIVGETRTACPAGEAKDVWLSNTCAPPIGSSPLAVQAPSAATKTEREPAVFVTGNKDPMDASCGATNGLASLGKPAGDLCAAGEATSVLGEGPWRWSCKGVNGGMTVSCAAPKASGDLAAKAKNQSADAPAAPSSEDGVCGIAAGTGTHSEPTTNLCAKGAASRVNGTGPWTWACSGTSGGAAASCLAPLQASGACGDAHDRGTETMPLRDLCAAGFASAVTGSGPWNWTCSGLNGGDASSCVAPLRQNAVCGDASARGQRETPSQNLCSVGEPSAVSGEGPWNWNCKGGDGGASVSCKAMKITDGVCGAAHGSFYEKAPKEGLCAAGRATRVAGIGPFNWACMGENDGATVSCTATLGTKEQVESVTGCGEAAMTLALSKPSEKLCAGGTASDVSGDGPWSWTCADDAEHVTRCSTLSPSAGVCGKAAGAPSAQAPTRDLCSSGTPSDATIKAKTSWEWTCDGASRAESVTCTAPIASALVSSTPAAAPFKKAGEADKADKTEKKAPVSDAACGSASGQNLSDKPTANLCAAGKASAVSGGVNWSWSCIGKKAKANCEAGRNVSGNCGSANGSVRKDAPLSELCASGTASEVSGSGPWMWSCIGSGTGDSASCSASSQAQTKVDGACGPATTALTKSIPTSGLCDGGMPSAVYGEGPWTWTCSGLNGGIASTCTAAMTRPVAPPPPGPLVNGVCGSSNGMAAVTAPEDDLCSSGVFSSLSGEGPWNWSCIGENGGMTVSCTAPLVPPAPIVGQCGASSGVPTLLAPKSALCASGISSAVSGKGPWTWSCSGTNGGGAVSCVAPLAGKGAATQSLPSVVTSSGSAPVTTTGAVRSFTDEAPAPKAAPLGLVTPQLGNKPLPAMKPGTLPDLKVQKKAKVAKVEEMPTALPPPELTDRMKGTAPAPIRDETKPAPGLKPPVIDSEGKPVPGTRLILKSDVSSISFEYGSDKLDEDAVEVCEKLVRILKENSGARITLIGYSDTDGKITPRDARRISLNRALAIRDFLTTKGIASGRADVRPMGANVPSGEMDRVDISVN